MRAVVQRVSWCKVFVSGENVAEIGSGLLVLVGVNHLDGEKDLKYIADKILRMRIFRDENEKMNLSVMERAYSILVVSQFTLYGDVRKGRRPSFTESAISVQAKSLYERLVFLLKEQYGEEEKIKTGIFQADMQIELLNDGPVTILLDSEKLF